MKKKSIELHGPLSHFPICSQDDDEDEDDDDMTFLPRGSRVGNDREP